MFESSEVRVFGQGTEQIAGVLAGSAHVGLPLFTATGPNSWVATWRGTNGLTPKVTVYAMPSAQGTTIQMSVGADLDQSSMIMFVLCLVLFWPAAAVLGYLAHSDFETKRRAFYMQFWQHMGQSLGAPMQALPAPGFAHPQPGFAPQAAAQAGYGPPGHGPPGHGPPGGYGPPGQ
jgi:hypothetical protein